MKVKVATFWVENGLDDLCCVGVVVVVVDGGDGGSARGHWRCRGGEADVDDAVREGAVWEARRPESSGSLLV